MRLAHGAVDDSFASAKGPRIGGGGGGVDSERRAAIGTPHGDSGSAKPHVCDASMSGDLPLRTRPVRRAVCHGADGPSSASRLAVLAVSVRGCWVVMSFSLG